MSLANSSLYSIVKKQYLFKLKSYTWFFFVMIIIQSLGILTAIFNLSGSMSSSNGMYTINIYKNTTIQILIFTIASVIGVIINLGAREWRNIDFNFVSNNLSRNISNIAFLITYAAFGAVTSALSATFVRIVKYFVAGGHGILEQGFFITPIQLLCSIGASFLYILLFSSICYFFTTLVQKSKLITIAILAAFMLLHGTNIDWMLIDFYVHEHSFFMFTNKVTITVILFFIISTLLSHNMEVER